MLDEETLKSLEADSHHPTMRELVRGYRAHLADQRDGICRRDYIDAVAALVLAFNGQASPADAFCRAEALADEREIRIMGKP